MTHLLPPGGTTLHPLPSDANQLWALPLRLNLLTILVPVILALPSEARESPGNPRGGVPERPYQTCCQAPGSSLILEAGATEGF